MNISERLEIETLRLLTEQFYAVEEGEELIAVLPEEAA